MRRKSTRLLYPLNMRSDFRRRDRELIQIVDSAFADAARRSGEVACLSSRLHAMLYRSLRYKRARRCTPAGRTQETGEACAGAGRRVRERARDAVSRLSKELSWRSSHWLAT